MNWDRVRIFLAVARTGQLVAAGKQLRLNHATVGRQLTMLEEELGAQLVKRSAGGCVLTTSGRALLENAERAEFELRSAESRLSGKSEAISGKVRVGAPDGFGNYFLARTLGVLTELHPDLTIQLVPLPQNFSLSRGDADLVIQLECPLQGRSVVKKLTDYSVSLYASKDYLASRLEIASIEHLGRHTLVTNIAEFLYSRELDYQKGLDLGAVRHFECCSVTGQIEAVRAGAGIGILHDFVAQQYPDLEWILPGFSLTKSYWMISHPDTLNLGKVRAVSRHITNAVQRQRHRFLNSHAVKH
jgi:DNA-binding transcriptional LysR family regulator